jgi:hypothetical protein
MQAIWAMGEGREVMDKKEEFEKCGVGVGLFELNGFPMRWRAFLKCIFELPPAWLKNPNKYKLT